MEAESSAITVPSEIVPSVVTSATSAATHEFCLTHTSADLDGGILTRWLIVAYDEAKRQPTYRFTSLCAGSCSWPVVTCTRFGDFAHTYHLRFGSSTADIARAIRTLAGMLPM